MESSKKAFNAIVAAALLSGGSAANAESDANVNVSVSAANINAKMKFLPLEKLAPIDRIILVDRVKTVLEQVKIDWKTVEVGVNEKGEIVFKSKDPNSAAAGQPSCWTIE